MKRSNTWRDVDDFDFGNEEEEEDEFRMVDAYSAKTKAKAGKRVQEQQESNSSKSKRVAKNGGGGRRKLEDDTMDWIARHRPTRVSQLAVNQKKVEEFAEWARGHQVGICSRFVFFHNRCLKLEILDMCWLKSA